MSANVAAFALTAMLLAFLSAHSLWRFFLRKQLPSLVHAAMPVLVFLYAGSEFQERIIQLAPSTLAIATAAAATVAFLLIVRHELRQEHPWN